MEARAANLDASALGLHHRGGDGDRRRRDVDVDDGSGFRQLRLHRLVLGLGGLLGRVEGTDRVDELLATSGGGLEAVVGEGGGDEEENEGGDH